MVDEAVKINRAPVMTLWAAVVAERLGFNHEEALTIGKVVAGLNAQAKGQRLGIFEPGEEKPETLRDQKREEGFTIQILGRPVPAVNHGGGVRATVKGKPVEPKSVESYLKRKFGESLGPVQKVMQELAESYDRRELSQKAYSLYEKFRPKIPEGARGWGAEGELSLDKIRELKG